MASSFCCFIQFSPESPPNHVHHDQKAGQATSIIVSSKPKSIWTENKKKKNLLHLQEQEQQQQQLNMVREFITLRDWILASPSLNKDTTNEDELHDFGQISNRAYPSFARGHADYTSGTSRDSFSTERLLVKFDEVDRGAMVISSILIGSSRSGKSNKKVRFTLPGEDGDEVCRGGVVLSAFRRSQSGKMKKVRFRLPGETIDEGGKGDIVVSAFRRSQRDYEVGRGDMGFSSFSKRVSGKMKKVVRFTLPRETSDEGGKGDIMVSAYRRGQRDDEFGRGDMVFSSFRKRESGKMKKAVRSRLPEETDDETEGDMLVSSLSRSQSGEIKKKERFRSLVEADAFIFCSPELEVFCSPQVKFGIE